MAAEFFHGDRQKDRHDKVNTCFWQFLRTHLQIGVDTACTFLYTVDLDYIIYKSNRLLLERSLLNTEQQRDPSDR
jgi:hypothetical protein